MWLRAVRLLVMAGVLSSATGCAIGGLLLNQGGHEDGSGTLSGAASQARSDSTTKVRDEPPPDVGWRTPPTTEVEVEPVAEPLAPTEGMAPGESVAPDEATAPRAKYQAPKTRRLFVGIVGGGGDLGGQAYNGYDVGGLMFGGYPEPRMRVDGLLTGDVLYLRGPLGRSFEDPGGINLDVTFRYYLTPDKTFLGLYPLVGVGTGTLMWNYPRPVTVIEDGKPKQIEDDMLNHFSIFGGVGASLAQFRWMHVGGSLQGGVRWYGWHTDSGLKNDTFPATGFFRVLVEVTVPVAKV